MTQPRRIASALILSALVLSACGTGDSSGLSTFRDASNRTIFELPAGWNHYSADALIQYESIPFIPRDNQPLAETFIAFDGAAGANPDNLTLNVTEATFPVGAQIIRTITAQEKEFLSRNSLLSSTYDFASVQGVENVSSDDFTFGSGFDGLSGIYGVTNNDGADQAAIYLVAVTNPEVTVMYSMAIGCTVQCFENRGEEIIKAVDSWLVNTRR